MPNSCALLPRPNYSYTAKERSSQTPWFSGSRVSRILRFSDPLLKRKNLIRGRDWSRLFNLCFNVIISYDTILPIPYGLITLMLLCHTIPYLPCHVGPPAYHTKGNVVYLGLSKGFFCGFIWMDLLNCITINIPLCHHAILCLLSYIIL